MSLEMLLNNNSIEVQECPKCRILRLKNAYIQDEQYFSTCHFCRAGKPNEQNYLNYHSARCSIFEGIPYHSLSTHTLNDLGDKEQVAITLNAVISKVISDYTNIIISQEVNHKMLNMLYKLTALNTRNLTFNKLNTLLNTPFTYAVDIKDVHCALYDLKTGENIKGYRLGEGAVTKLYKHFDLNPKNINYKRQKELVRKKFNQNRAKYKKQLIALNGSNCYLCSKELSDDEITIDHIVPIINGGTNDLDNLGICCEACNSMKSNKNLEDVVHSTTKNEKSAERAELLISENAHIEASIAEIDDKVDYYLKLKEACVNRKNLNAKKLNKIKEYQDLIARAEVLKLELGL